MAVAAPASALRVTPATGREPGGLVTRGCEVRGRIEYPASIRIQGLVEGEIVAREEVVIDASGVARARIQADRIRVAGLVEGDLQATSRVEIAATGEVAGDIVAPAIVIEEGGVLEGRVRMGNRRGTDRPNA